MCVGKSKEYWLRSVTITRKLIGILEWWESKLEFALSIPEIRI
jgi:hypothetical protein